MNSLNQYFKKSSSKVAVVAVAVFLLSIIIHYSTIFAELHDFNFKDNELNRILYLNAFLFSVGLSANLLASLMIIMLNNDLKGIAFYSILYFVPDYLSVVKSAVSGEINASRLFYLIDLVFANVGILLIFISDFKKVRVLSIAFLAVGIVGNIMQLFQSEKQQIDVIIAIIGCTIYNSALAVRVFEGETENSKANDAVKRTDYLPLMISLSLLYSAYLVCRDWTNALFGALLK